MYLHHAILQLIDSGDQTKLEELILKDGIIINCCWWDYELLEKAVRKGNVEITKFLTEQGCRVNKTLQKPYYNSNTDVTTLLHTAVEDQNIDIVRLLLEKGASIEKKNRFGETPLVLAVKIGNEEIIDLILQKSQNIENGSKSGLEEFHVACIKGHIDIVDRCIRSGVSINKQISLNSPIWPRYTPLHLTVLSGHYESVQSLLDAGAEVNAKNMEGMTALHLALQMVNCKDSVKLLLKRGGIINPTLGTTMLHIAAEYSDVDAVRILLENGAKVNVFNKAGVTPLQIAVKRVNLEIVRLLIENKADINCADKIEKETPLHFAVKYSSDVTCKLLYEHREENRKNNTQLDYTGSDDLNEIVTLLIKRGADINLKNNKGRTPLHFFVECKPDFFSPIQCIKTISKLIMTISQRHCSKLINQIDDCGFSHFLMACICGETKIVLDFLKRGEDVNQSVKEHSEKWALYTPLLFALENKCRNVVILLLVHGVYVNHTAISRVGTTPLHLAVKHMDKDIIGMILENGGCTDINAYDKNGHAPLHIAVRSRDLEIVKLLIRYKANLNCITDNNILYAPLHFAIREMHFEIFYELLTEGANVNAKIVNGRTVLHLYVYDASVESQDTELDMEIVKGHSKVIASILKAGADINAEDLSGNSPLDLAFESSPDVFYALLEHGPNINSVEKFLDVDSAPLTSMQDLNKKILDEHKEKRRARIIRAQTGFFPRKR